MMDRRAWAKIISNQTGHDVYVLKTQHPLYLKLKQAHSRNYHLTTIFRNIYSLNAQAAKGSLLKNSGVSVRALELDGMAIEYFIDNGDVLIKRLHCNQAFQAQSQTVGIYPTKYLGNEWKIDKTPKPNMDLNHKWRGAHYAAVTGRFRRREDSGKQLAQHIAKAFANGSEIAQQDMEIRKNHFSTIFIRKGEHSKANASDCLASCIQQAAHKKVKVHWLVHGEGARTFKTALDAIAVMPQLKEALALQKIYFSNPVGFTKEQLEKLCQQAGIKYVDTKVNARNLRNTAELRNAAKELLKISSEVAVIGGAGAIATKAGVTGLQTAASKAADAISSGPAGMAGAAFVAGAAIVYTGAKSKAAYDKIKGSYNAMRAMTSSTLGRGNEFWFESDEDLLQQLDGA